MLLTKYKIQVTKEQVDVFWNLSEQCRLLYNFALSERKEAWSSSMNYEPTEVEYLMRASNAGFGECRMEDITIVGGNAKELRRRYGRY